MYSLMGKKDKACKHLDKAVTVGRFDADMAGTIKGDADFDNIRKDPRYAKALAKARSQDGGAADDGEETVNFEWKVTLPRDYDESEEVPLIVALHSRGGDMAKATKRWKKAARKVGAILLAPQGTVKVDGGGFQWGSNLGRIEENVMDAINEVMDEYEIDQDRVILTGFSQGAWATWALALRSPDTFCGIIPVAGRFEAPSESYFEDEDLAKLRIVVMVGEDDNDDLVKGNKKAAKRFKGLGAEVKLHVYEGIGHAFPDDAVKEQVKALRFILED
jgi:predicted esterase